MVDPTDITEPTGVTGEVVASETDMGDENSQAAASREAIDQLSAAYSRMREEIGKAIVGQHEIVDQLLVSLFSGGHRLLEGVPGLAKTLLVSTIAEILQLSFRCIPLTPDLLP